MKLFSALLLTPLVSKVEGQGSLRASTSQALQQSLPKADLLAPNGAVPFNAEVDLEQRKLAISQQCATDTLDLWGSFVYSAAYDAWIVDRGAAELDCMDTAGNGLKCPVDSKLFGESHENLVSACQDAGGISALCTYFTICYITLDDGTTAPITFEEIDNPGCVAGPPSCTNAEFDEVMDIRAEGLAENAEETLVASSRIVSATCTESAPICTPTTALPTTPLPTTTLRTTTALPAPTTVSADQQCIADMNALYAGEPLKSASEKWWSEHEYDIQNGCTPGSCIFDSNDYSYHKDVLDACNQLGGVKFLFTDYLSCEGSNATSTYRLVYGLVDHPQCIATTCDIDEHVERLDAILDDLGETLEARYSPTISNFQCISTDSVVSEPGLTTTPPPPTRPPTRSRPSCTRSGNICTLNCCSGGCENKHAGGGIFYSVCT